jgi:hypothetical protein
VPASITAGSAEKTCITRSLNRKVSTPPIPIQTRDQRSAIREASLASAGTRAPML